MFIMIRNVLALHVDRVLKRRYYLEEVVSLVETIR